MRPALWGSLLVLALVLAGGFVSYVWIPRYQVGAAPSWFVSFCTALGVPQHRPSAVTLPPGPHSDVIVTHQLLAPATPRDIGDGATLALRCTPCHGPTGISYANSPNLAGQYAIAIYKQLRDYRSGVRTNAIMNPMAQSLTDTDMREIAAYYASLQKPAASRLTAEPPPIVRWGAPMRDVPPCGSCHGMIDHTLAGPWLNGEPRAYLLQQLQAFAAGTRDNDINAQMRAVAHGMTAAEIAAAAAYYSGEPSGTAPASAALAAPAARSAAP
jgi:cytochrome c553